MPAECVVRDRKKEDKRNVPLSYRKKSPAVWPGINVVVCQIASWNVRLITSACCSGVSLMKFTA